jgi:preprotein translocase subunit SecD
MNRYSWWKYSVLVIALLVGSLYTTPNFFGESPAVQVSSGKATLKLDSAMVTRVGQVLSKAGLVAEFIEFEGNSVKARFPDTDTQFKAKDALGRELNPEANDPQYIVALNLLSRSPKWLSYVRALPMYLGLDLRGGVHFLMQVDMKAVLTSRAESLAGDIRTLLRDKAVRHAGISRENNYVTVRFKDPQTLQAAQQLFTDQFQDLNFSESMEGTDHKLTGTFLPEAAKRVQELALKQNITTLHNRVNELGVAEPVIAQQGADRVVVQLPGVQDTAKAKDIIRRTATLEVRLVDDSAQATAALTGGGPIPYGAERYTERGARPLIVQRQVILTGENLTNAQPGFDTQTHEATVDLTLDSKGARIFKEITRDNIGRRMAILLFEKGKGEVVTAPVIRSEIGGGRVQISGSMNAVEANDTALLLRAGSLAAPMEIIEEKTIGPTLGAGNIQKGFQSVLFGFAAITVFMVIYYRLFGMFSALALAVNLLLLVAVLSMAQATLSLPGMAAIALTLGMAIDANVLINERVREELRAGVSPQAAIHAGYERAFATILDSNVTTLIAGIALFCFGSGPVKGFALVHCVGILTSMFSAVFFSRGLVNLWYGRQKKLRGLSIGQIWNQVRSPQNSNDVSVSTPT